MVLKAGQAKLKERNTNKKRRFVVKVRPNKEVIWLSQGDMTVRSCRPAFSLPFHGLIVARQVNFSDEVPDQFNLLPAMATRLVWRMDEDFLY